MISRDIIKNLDKYCVRKSKIYTTVDDCDIKLTASSGSDGRKHINVLLKHRIFSQYSYITFYAVDKRTLVMKLSNTPEPNAYKITNKGNSYMTKLSGEGYNRLLPYCGAHRVKLYNGTGSDPLWYLEVSKNA